MSNTKKQQRSRWLLALAVVTSSSCGCTSWSHHIGKHSLLAQFQKKHQAAYSQCEHCGQIVLNDNHHQCSRCTPQPAFYGFKSTCWNAWPMGWAPCPPPETKGCLVNGENAVLHESMLNASPVAQNTTKKETAELQSKKEVSSEASTPVSLDEPTSKTESEAITDPSDSASDDKAGVPNLEQAEEKVFSEPTIQKVSMPEIPVAEKAIVANKELKSEEQEANEVATQPEKSNFEAANETTESDEIHVEKTIPATKISFEKPRIATLEFSEPTQDAPVAPAPDQEQKSSRKVSNHSELLPVSPASAQVATPMTSDSTISDSTDHSNMQGPASRLTELKLFMKEVRSTALHLSLAKKLDVKNSGAVSPPKSERKAESARPTQEIVPSKSDEGSFSMKPAIVEPTSKKLSLLDRLCPKS